MAAQHPQVEYWATEGDDYVVYRGRIPHGGMGRNAVLFYVKSHELLYPANALLDEIPRRRVSADQVDLTVAALFAIHNDAIAEAIAAG